MVYNEFKILIRLREFTGRQGKARGGLPELGTAEKGKQPQHAKRDAGGAFSFFVKNSWKVDF